MTIAGSRPEAARIKRLEQAGAHRVFFWLPAGREELWPELEHCDAAVEEYLGAGSQLPR